MRTVASLVVAACLSTTLAAAPAAEPTLGGVVPVVGSTPGVNGALFRTELQLHNPTAATISGKLVFRTIGLAGSESDASLAYELLPRATKNYSDIVADLGKTGLGSLDIIPSDGAMPLAIARAYDDHPSGTKGVLVPVVLPHEAIQPGQMVSLIAPADKTRARMNIGLRTLSEGARVRFTVFAADGSVKLALSERDYPADYFVQQSAAILIGQEIGPNESVAAVLTAGRAIFYATSTDNKTNDPSIQLGEQKNILPIVDPISVTVPTDTAQIITIHVTEGDGENVILTFTSPQHGTLGTPTKIDSTTYQVVYTPTSGYTGPDTFNVTAEDENGGSSTAAASINVGGSENNPPVAPDQNVSTQEDRTITITLTATDADGDSLVFTIVTPPEDGSVGPIVQTGPRTATITYRGRANFGGADSFVYEVTDPHGATDRGTVRITVTGVNDRPNANPNTYSVAEDNVLNVPAPGVLGNDNDVDDSNLTATQVSGPSNGTLVLNADGSFTYTPNANFFGTDSFSYTASDGTDPSNPAVVTITVTPVNDAPSFAAGGDQTINEDAGPQTVTPWATAISAGPANESAQTLTFNVTGNTNPTLFSAGPTVLADGTLQYTPAANASGFATITLTLSDNGGTANGGVNTSGPQSFMITVNPVNDAPTFVKGADQTVLEDSGAQNVNPWATGITAGPADESSQTLTFNVTGNSNPSLFSAGPTVLPDGSLQYTPAPDANGSATITLTLSDDGGTANGGVDTSVAQTFVINVTPVNDAPSFTGGGDQTVNEDAGAQSVNPWATGITAGPADESTQTLTFNITGNTDPALFSVQPSISSTGVLTYTTAPDANGSATITVTLSDNGGTANGGVDTSAPTQFDINVTAVNDPPTVTGATFSVPENSPNGTNVGTVTGNDVEGSSLTWSITGGNTNNAFTIDANTGVITVANQDELNFEVTTSYTLTVEASDGSLAGSATVTVNITNVNEAPSDINLSAATIAENQPAGTPIGTLSTVDVDAGDTHTYTLVAGAGDTGNASFTIVGNQLRTAASFDFEAQQMPLSVRVRTTDAGGLTYEEVFVITITDVNEAPTDITLDNATIDENQPSGTPVGNLSTTDQDPTDTHTYTLVAGAGSTDNASFQIVGGVLQTAAVLDFETKSSYSVRIRTTDAGGLFHEESFTITVTNVNEAPTDIALSNASIPEDTASGATVGNFTTTDSDLGDTHTYTLVAGAGDTDNAAFAIVGNQLQTATTFDFETQSSFSIRVRTTDASSLTYEEVFTITITNVNEAPTDITLSANSVAENQPSGTTVGTLSSTDVDASDTHTYTLVAGAGSTDNASFAIVGNALNTAASFDFETKSSYSVRIRTTDAGGLFFEEVFTITVTDANEAPTDIALSNNTVPENQAIGTGIGNFSSTDGDAGDTFTYTLVAGTGSTDNAAFQIVGNQLQNAAILNFEAQSSYSIRVRTTDAGGAFFEEVFTISVTNVNDAPTDIALSNNTVTEGQPIGTPVGTLTTTDQDAGDTHTYTLVAGTGDTGNASFQIVGNELRTNAVFSFPVQSSYSVRIRTTDAGGLFYEEVFTITVGDVNTAPTDIDLSNATVAENQASGTAVGNFSTTDADAGDTFTYTLVAGVGDTDNASFAIVGNALNTAAMFDFETKSSYTIRVRSTDQGGLFVEEAFTITVTNGNDAPTDLAIDGTTVNENSDPNSVVGNMTTTDPDPADTHTYTLVAGVGDTDNATFTITGGNELRVNNVALDFETKSSYSVRVRTTDSGGLFYEEVIVVTVIDGNDDPTDITLSNNTVAEDAALGTTVGTLSTTDVDAGATHTYALVAGAGDTDNGSFTIVGNALQTNASFDFETKSSYTVRIQSTDNGGGTFQEAFTITITNVNETPTAVALSANTVAENLPIATAVGNFSTTDPDVGNTFTYTLVAGTGSTDNGSFSIVGNQLQTAATFDFETKSSYSIRVRSTDQGGLFFEQTFTITVVNANETPTDMALAPTAQDENTAINTMIGTFSTTDPDPGDTFTYTLVAGTGSTDNASFNIAGNQLRNSIMFNFEVKSSYSIRVRTTDAGGLFYEEAFIITVNNVPEAPIAGADAFDAVGNTLLEVDDTAAAAEPKIYFNGNLLTNDTDPDTGNNAGLTTSLNTASPGAVVTVNSDGTFTYVPPAGHLAATDSFTYTVTDPALLTAVGTVTITLKSEVWYVKNDHAAGGLGRSIDPFDTLAEAEAASGPNDTIYIFNGDGAITNQNTGFIMESGQRLLGEFVALTMPATVVVNTVPGPTLRAATGVRPKIHNNTLDAGEDNGVSVPAASAFAANEIAGLEISGIDNAIDITVTGAGSANVTITSNTIAAAGLEGIDVNANSTGTTTIAVTSNTITSTGRGMDARTGAAGTLVVAFNTNTVTSTAGAGVVIDGSFAGSTAHVTGLLSNTVTGNTSGGGISIVTARLDATVGGPYQTLNGGTTIIGSAGAGNGVGGPGLSLTTVSGDLSFTDLDVFTDNGSALVMTGTGQVNIGAGTGTQLTVPLGSTLVAVNGAALELSDLTANVTPSTFSSTNSTVTGASLVNVNGTVTVPSGATITNATGIDFNISGGTANVSYAGTITDDIGQLVSVASTTAGTKTFSGAITDGNDGDGSGISLVSNTGATIDFTGDLTLSTGANPAFAATGGGTVSVTGTNTIATTTGTALNVSNTTIGAANLNFRSISAGTAASGPANGILLNTTGATGRLLINGTGGAASGGTIQRTTSHGISLTSTTNPLFNNLSIQTTGGSGIKGTQVAGFTLTNSVIDNSGTSGGANEGNVVFNTGAAGTETNLTGAVVITGNTLTNGLWYGVDILNFNGTITNLNVSSNTLTSSTSAAASLGSAIRVQVLGNAATASHLTTATINGNTITNFPSGAGVMVQGGNASTTGPAGTLGTPGSAVNIISITNNLIRGASAANRMGTSAILGTVSGGNPGARSQGNFAINNNGTVANPLAHTVGHTLGAGTNGYATTTFTTNNNVIVSNNGLGSNGISGGNGIVVTSAETPNMNWTMTGNNISQTDGNGILAVGRGVTGSLTLKIQNNTVAAPLGGVRQGIRVDAGNAASVDDAVCLNISGNTSAGNAGAGGGIGLRKQGNTATTNDFAINGMAANSSPNVEAYVNGLNPAGGGTLLISATVGFSNCSNP